MKIEKINDNQIRCTLTRDDLASRELKLSELICGSEKAKSLFHDMMQQAAAEFGFEADNMPLMIEAIPSSPDSIVLIVTKVENPEELDSKFSKLGPSLNDSDSKRSDSKKHNLFDKLEGAEDLLNLINKVKKAVSEPPKDISENDLKSEESDRDSLNELKSEESDFPKTESDSNSEPTPSKIRLFSFATLDSVIHACRLMKHMYHGANTLYKDTPNGIFILVLSQSEHTTSQFNKICNMLSEYGSAEKSTSAMLAFLEEHCEIIVPADAIEQLGNL